MDHSASAFARAIADAGFTPPDIIADGRLHRFATGKKHDDAGWYVLYLDGIGAGAFGDWRTGLTQKWRATASEPLTASQRREQRKALREARKQRDAERERLHAEAAETAKAAWQAAKPAPADHPYLQAKQVQPHGLRVDDDNQLLVPMAVDGAIVSLQLIDAAGDKCFIPGGRTAGARCLLGKPGDTLYICEGFATAASVYEATGATVAVAFNAGNLKAVATALRRQYPDAALVMVADNDCGDGENVGVAKANAAGAAVGARVVVPELNGKKCDFNDIYVAHGAEAVREQLACVYPSRDAATVQPHPANHCGASDQRLQPGMQPSATLQPDPPALAFRESILSDFREAIAACGVVGEKTTAATIYLLLTSRLLDKPVSAAVKGHSASGKSYTAEKTVSFFPDEAVITMTAMSERALIYSDQEYAHRVLVLYEATAMRENAEDNLTAYFIRSLLSEGRIEYPVTVRGDDGQYTTQTIVKEGPTGLLVTTTKTQIHAENETRLLSLATDDSRGQTARVFAALAAETEYHVNKQPWLELQAWLQVYGERRVTIPYAQRLAELVPPVAVRLRRDFGAVLALIRAHAILHQANRDTDDKGRIIATVADYAEVRALIAHVVAEGVGATVSAVVRETVAVVDDLADADGVSAMQVAERLNLDKSTLSRRMRMAAEGGYVRNLEDRRGKPGRWVIGDPMPEEITLLPETDAVARLQTVAAPVATDKTTQSTEYKQESETGCTVARAPKGETGENHQRSDTGREHLTV